MDWGNAFVTSKTPASAPYTHVNLTLHLEGDFKKTSKKVTWLATPTSTHSLVPVVLIDYDYLITKKRLEEDDVLDDILNRQSEVRVKALASAEVVHLKKWDIIQFERKGFYICQGTKDAEGRMEFGFIPEYVESRSTELNCSGRAGSVALKAAPAKETVKAPGAAKGSWGKTAPKAKPVVDGVRIMLSEGSSGFEIPVKTGMFEADRI